MSLSYVDALWTVQLVGGKAVTVPSCLADNMAKSIHLEQTDAWMFQTKAPCDKKSHEKVRLIAKRVLKRLPPSFLNVLAPE